MEKLIFQAINRVSEQNDTYVSLNWFGGGTFVPPIMELKPRLREKSAIISDFIQIESAVAPMDYELIVSALQKASAFDLYRLQSAIGLLLDDPLRLNAIKRQLRPGMEITYFEPQENRLIPAQVLEIRRTRVAIQELSTGKRWTVPLYMINIEGADTDITPKKNHVDRLSLKIGDQVGFTGKDGSELFGTVIKLNPKRARIQTRQGIWAVPYSMLFAIIDGEQTRDPFIPAELVLFTDDCVNSAPDDDNITR